MILVRLAGSARWCSFCPVSTLPVLKSISTWLRAAMVGGGCTGAATATAAERTRTRSPMAPSEILMRNCSRVFECQATQRTSAARRAAGAGLRQARIDGLDDETRVADVQPR